MDNKGNAPGASICQALVESNNAPRASVCDAPSGEDCNAPTASVRQAPVEGSNAPGASVCDAPSVEDCDAPVEDARLQKLADDHNSFMIKMKDNFSKSKERYEYYICNSLYYVK